MAKKTVTEQKGGAWIFRDIPRDLMKRAKIAAAVEGKTIKALLLEALDDKIQEPEKKGLLTEGKRVRNPAWMPFESRRSEWLKFW